MHEDIDDVLPLVMNRYVLALGIAQHPVEPLVVLLKETVCDSIKSDPQSFGAEVATVLGQGKRLPVASQPTSPPGNAGRIPLVL